KRIRKLLRLWRFHAARQPQTKQCCETSSHGPFLQVFSRKRTGPMSRSNTYGRKGEWFSASWQLSLVASVKIMQRDSWDCVPWEKRDCFGAHLFTRFVPTRGCLRAETSAQSIVRSATDWTNGVS